MILPIVAYGSNVLRKETEEIEEGSDIKKLVDACLKPCMHLVE